MTPPPLPTAISLSALPPEWFRFLSALLAYAEALEARIAALEAKS